MANWYVKRGSQTAGPLTQERLKELAIQGNVQESDLVKKGENGNFIPAGQIPGLLPDSDDGDEFETNTQSQSESAAPKKNNTVLIVVLAIVGGGGGLLLILLLVALLLPAIQGARNAARYSQSKNNMKLIGLALYNYHDSYSMFPPGGTTTTEGKPYHSWQASILPFIDQAPLYNEIDFDKPWDDPVNQFVFQQIIPPYLNPAIEDKVSPDGYGLSHYVGNQRVMKKNIGIRFRDITDGTSNTILAVETGQNFKPWGDPTSIADPSTIMGRDKKTAYRGGNHVLLGDGSVRFISKNVDPKTLKQLSIPDDGQIVGEF
ncbi:DUF1559 domain-containing protein [uncultured Gimesia sp.]|uniref:DUF1559 family PulG-like putative transporter n=1 Tax=uncultured Gimesia sp. TaxID=1678688 RepID=UPI0030DD7311